MLALPRSRFVNNMRTHFVLVNTAHFVRLNMLDRHGYASLNHSSIHHVISSSDNSLAAIESADDSYDHRFVQIANKTGHVTINSVSKGYHSARASSYFGHGESVAVTDLGVGIPIKDQLNIEVVNNVDIEPKQKTIYYLGKQNPWKFALLEGSGHFAVTVNDTSLVDVQHVEREVTLVP
jgi:hypothetical protein